MRQPPSITCGEHGPGQAQEPCILDRLSCSSGLGPLVSHLLSVGPLASLPESQTGLQRIFTCSNHQLCPEGTLVSHAGLWDVVPCHHSAWLLLLAAVSGTGSHSGLALTVVLWDGDFLPDASQKDTTG